ncbi:hypothetical protein BRX43_10580 [Sphingomonas sp. S-NIH.Pt15_0812]|nr:hypothetical protein BRX43_10580 [Sphingomonas sp. S-NIH.Pt15_0812]
MAGHHRGPDRIILHHRKTIISIETFPVSPVMFDGPFDMGVFRHFGDKLLILPSPSCQRSRMPQCTSYLI